MGGGSVGGTSGGVGGGCGGGGPGGPEGGGVGGGLMQSSMDVAVSVVVVVPSGHSSCEEPSVYDFRSSSSSSEVNKLVILQHMELCAAAAVASAMSVQVWQCM